MTGRRVRLLGDILLMAGGLILAYPLWSAAYAHVQQARLDSSYRAAAPLLPAPQPSRAGPPSGEESLRHLALSFGRRLEAGDAIGHMRIPRLGLETVVAHGAGRGATLDPKADRALLRKGPVHYAVTPLPGVGEPFAVAGHRTTYGGPFRRLDRLKRGDAILLDTPYASFRYSLVKTTVVKPDDIGVLLDRGYGLVLTTCTPPYSASHRLIVWAVLDKVTLRR